MGIQHPFGCLSQCFYHLRMQWPDTFKVSQLEKMTMNKTNEALRGGNSGWCLQWGISPASVSSHLELILYCPKMFLFRHWPLIGSSGTGRPRRPHYLRQSVFHPTLQSIIIQMRQPQWEEKICKLISLQQPLLSTP